MNVVIRDSKGKHIHTYYYTKYANQVQRLLTKHWENTENWYVCKRGCSHSQRDKDCECKCHKRKNK